MSQAQCPPSPKTFYPFPIDYNLVRKAMVDEVQKVTGLVCIVMEPETQNVPRPPLPYFGIKFLIPGFKFGDDAYTNIPDNQGHTTSNWNYGGQRRMTIDFQCFGRSHEEAYTYMILWQGALETYPIQFDLRLNNIAFWLNGNVADLSQLLNTGYEGRSQMDVQFGIASNINTNLGEMDVVSIDGEVNFDGGSDEYTETVES